MRYVINLALFFIICGLIYVLYSSIQEPIAFNTEKTLRQGAVESRLKAIRAAQGVFREIQGEGYSPDFDSLVQVIRTGQIPIVSVIGDKDNVENPTITYDTSYVSGMDKIAEINEGNLEFTIILDSLRYVPYSGGMEFDIKADTITYQQTLVNVLEVKTQKKNYMGKYASPHFARYDATYDPDAYIRFGNLSAPNLTGNWE